MNGHLRYYFREAAASFSRGGAMSLVAVLALTLAALSLSAYALLRQNTHFWLSKAESRFEAVVYLKDGVDEPKARALGEQIKALPEVSEITLISPADAAKELSKDSALAEYFGVLGGENPLPWSARVRTKAAEAEALNSLSTKAKALDGVADVDWGQESTESLLKWMKLLRSSLLILGIALGISAALVTASVIRLTVHARRDEIAIMRMVGASYWFIRIPFLLEGFLQGLVGGAAGCLLLAGIGRLVTLKAMAELQLDLSAYLPYSVTGGFLAEVTLASALLGFAGSLMAVGGPFREKG
jgi:cell division transport system permease protein